MLKSIKKHKIIFYILSCMLGKCCFITLYVNDDEKLY